MARRSRRSTQRSRNRARARARAQSAARARNAAKSNKQSKSTKSQSSKPAPKKKPTLTGPGMGPRGKLSSALSQKVRARFKQRESEGRSGLTGGPKGESISSYRSRQKKSVQDAARARNAKFKQTRVQTFGGKKKVFTKSEQKRIEKAGYKVDGYSKAPAQSNTQLQVNKDNQMYGNTFPSGAIGISEEGKALAAKQRAEAAAKKAAEAAAAKKAEAARVAAAKKEATRQRTFDPTRVFGDKAFSQYMQAGGIRGVNMSVFNNPNNYLNKGMNERIKNEQFARFGDPFSTFRKNPDPRTLFGDDALQVGKSDKNFAAGKRGNPFGRPDQAFNIFRPADKGGPGSGPTPLTRETIKRFGPTTLSLASSFLPGYNIGSKLFNEGRTGSALDKSLSNVDNVNVGGLSIGFKSDPSTDIGARVGSFFTSLPGKISDAFTGGDDTKVASAGGLNIGGGVDSGDAPQSKVGRVLTFGKNLVQQPKALVAYGADVANQLFSPRLADGTLKGNMDFAGNLPGDKGFDNRDVQIKSAVNNAMDSKFVQQFGENLGLPKDFKAQTKDALAALGENYKGATADRDGIYKGTSETLKNLSSDKRLAPVAKFLNQLGTENENVTDADRNKKFSMMGFQTPINNETAADIITAFQPNVEKMPGLSRADRGLIEGGGGNRLISGKLTDIAREALTGNIGTGESLGLAKGSPLTIGNMVDAGNLIASNKETEGTLASKRSQEIANLANKAGKITTPSIIKGLIPRFGGSGSFRPNAVSSLGEGATTLAAATPTSVEEVLPLPTTATQTGTDSGNLASIMQDAYQNQMSLYGMNPNYFAQFRRPRFNRPRKRFRQVFNRGYF